MRKWFVLAAALVAMASCGNKNAQSEGTIADSTEYNPVDTTAAPAPAKTVASPVADSLTKVLTEQLSAKDAKQVKATVKAVMAKYQELFKAGKADEAAAYASQVKSFVDTHAEEIKNIAKGNATVAEVVNGIANLPTDAKQAATAAAAAVNGEANAAAQAAGKAAARAKASVKKTEGHAKQAVTDAKTQASQNAKAVKKAAEADAKAKVESAKQKTRDAANKAVNDALNKALGQ